MLYFNSNLGATLLRIWREKEDECALSHPGIAGQNDTILGRYRDSSLGLDLYLWVTLPDLRAVTIVPSASMAHTSSNVNGGLRR